MDGRDTPTADVDLVIVGSGVAGLSAAVRASRAGMRVALVSKAKLPDTATRWAQGGVAAVLHHSEADRPPGSDSEDLHAADTIRAGGGLCDLEAVAVLVGEGPARVRDLADLGAEFDRDGSGRWRLAREGGHSTARVVHAGGVATGAEVERALVEAAVSGASSIREECFAVDLLVADGVCRGVKVIGADRTPSAVAAPRTLLATGGAGQLYPVTTNPPQATGDGVAMALRAGVAVADVEFVQFHPTALHGSDGGPRLLLSEALRGDGAVLRDLSGKRFVDELQPRDVVAAAVAARMRDTGSPHVWLDVSGIVDFELRFPTLAPALRDHGSWLPVAPAAHYLCGGIVTDLDGATTLPGLWAAGEVACTGVHGANRLASNSLLEGMVFAARAVEAMIAGRVGPAPTGALRAVLDPASCGPGSVGARRLPVARVVGVTAGGDDDKARGALQQAMFDGAGVERSAESLDNARTELEALADDGVPTAETANLWAVASAVVAAAQVREESRGGHRRSDLRQSDPSFSHRFVQW